MQARDTTLDKACTLASLSYEQALCPGGETLRQQLQKAIGLRPGVRLVLQLFPMRLEVMVGFLAACILAVSCQVATQHGPFLRSPKQPN